MDLAAAVCAQGMLAASPPRSRVSRVDLRQEVLGWVRVWLVGVMGGRKDCSPWGGWNCHVYHPEVHSRLKAEVGAIPGAAGWSLHIPPLRRLNFLRWWKGQA